MTDEPSEMPPFTAQEAAALASATGGQYSATQVQAAFSGATADQKTITKLWALFIAAHS